MATFNVAAGENVTCTYTNTKRGSITVKKLTDPAGDAAKFDFSGDLTGPIGDGESIGPKSVAPGTYSTTEAAKTGWDLTKISCSDDDSSGDTGSGVATFNVAAGENVTCTYTNVEQRLDHGQEADRPRRGPGHLRLQRRPRRHDRRRRADRREAGGPRDLLDHRGRQDGLGSDQDQAATTTDSSGDTGSGKATFNVAAGENVTCTYTNTKRGSITVKKLTDPPGDAAKFYFSGDLTGPIGDGQSIGPKSVAPGTYSTTEAAKTGWDLTKIKCDGHR